MDLNAAIYGNGRPPPPFGLVTISPPHLAEYEARRLFHGRDWRRIKREIRKAVNAARGNQHQGVR